MSQTYVKLAKLARKSLRMSYLRVMAISFLINAELMHYLPTALPHFADATILVVGDIMLDRYWFGTVERISPEAPVPIAKINACEHRPGGAGNVALNISALGAKAILIGTIGTDEAANIITNQLDSSQVTHDIYQANVINTIIKLRIISRHQQLLRLDFEQTIYPTALTEILSRVDKYLTQVNLIIISDYNKGTVNANLIQAIIARAQVQKIPVLIDPKAKDFNIYRGATLITPNYKEFEALAGKCDNEQTILIRAREILTQHKFAAMLITRGEHGMTLIDPSTCIHLSATAREVIDVTGAGDTVISTLGASLATSSTSIINAVALANLAAGIAVSKLGAVTVSEPELNAALTDKTNIHSGILNEEQVLNAVQHAQAQGKKIVFTNGCFDILHAGHVLCLQLAKELGDYLIVAVNTDKSIKKIKGEHRPINNLEHRMTVLAGLGVVDWVVPFDDETPNRLLKLLRPDILIKGGEYRLDQVVGSDIVQSYGGQVRILGQKISSSSDIIAKIRQQIPESTIKT